MTRANVSAEELSHDMNLYYSLVVTECSELESYDDCMYRINVEGGGKYAVKYYNISLIDKDILSDILLVLGVLTKDCFNIPKPLENVSGATLTEIVGNDNTGCKDPCLLVVFKYVEGTLLANTARSDNFWEKLDNKVLKELYRAIHTLA